jgi:serine/threonine protein phosphatase PrpC
MGTSTSANSNFQVTMPRCAAGTDVGMRREENQDSFGVIRGEDFSAFFVADGMGGAQGGAIASRMVIAALETELSKSGYRIAPDRIIDLIKDINRQVFEKGSNEPRYAGMGTTLVGLIFTSLGLLGLNVGDSRAYRIRAGRIEQISEDHTLVRELVRSGALAETEAEHHPVSHMLTRSLGPVADVQVECRFLAEKPEAGDMYVLCSDGLYNLVPESDILGVVSQNPLDDANQILINLANQRGGTDNITALVIAVSEEQVRDRSVPQEKPEIESPEEPSTESDEAVHESERRVEVAPPVVQEPAETKRVRKTKIGKGGDFRSVSSSTPMVMILGLTLGVGLVLGSVVRQVFWSLRLERPTGNVDRNRDADGVGLREGGAENVGSEGRSESPLSELARQIRRVDKVSGGNSNHGVTQASARREDIVQSIGTLRSQIDLLDRPPSSDATSNMVAAKLRHDALFKEYQQLNTRLDAASRAVTLWVRRQVKFEDPDVFAHPGELEKVGAYSENVKQKLAVIASLSYQYGEKADEAELHPDDESRRVELESLARKRDDLKRELKDEVRKAVAGLFAKSYTEYETLKNQQDILWPKLQEVKRELEVLSGLAESDPLKRRALQATLRLRLEDEMRQLGEFDKSRTNAR